MTATPNDLTEAPALPAASVELLADVLRRVRLAGAIFLYGEFSAPWGFTSTDAATLPAVVAPGAKRLVLLHLAVEGGFRITLPSGESASCSAGDAIVLPYCDVHSMMDPPGTRPVPIVDQYAEGAPPSQAGWLTALRDPVVGKALVLMHSRPAEPWTVTDLARRVAVSRSLLAERFTRALGLSPMRYLMQWRLQLAAELLRSSRIGLAPLAERVGYDSEAAFSRAFKRHLGVSPAAWRERRA